VARVSQPKYLPQIDKNVDVQTRDGVSAAPHTRYSADYNTGANTIHTGGNTASYVLLPIIPPKSRRK
jgi:hypothetical protein